MGNHKGYGEIIKTGGPGAGSVAEIVMDEVIDEPSISAQRHSILFLALKEYSQKLNSTEFEASLAMAAARGVDAEYQTMSRNPGSFDFILRSDLLVEYLKYLTETRYAYNLGTVRALSSDSSPSEKVRAAAKALLRLAEGEETAAQNSRPNLPAGFPQVTLDDRKLR